MGHCLTQPEEIDYALRAMADHEMETDAPIPYEVQPSGTTLDIERDDLTMTPDFSYGAEN